jgi:CheY-like chemotaxis protein
MNGYDAARHIRQQTWGKGIALIALSGWGQEGDKRRAIAAGFDHDLTKPVEAATLQKLVVDLHTPYHAESYHQQDAAPGRRCRLRVRSPEAANGR